MTALLLIDIQKGLQELDFYGEERNNPNAEANSAKLLEAFRSKNMPIYHVQHCSLNPDSPLHPTNPGNDFNPLVQPKENEPIFKKHVNSAFIGTDLENTLKKDGISEVVIAGLTTEHCVSTSTRMAANLGFKVQLISDATAAFNKIGINGETYSAALAHSLELANLKDEFATILDTQTLLAQIG